MIKIIRKKSTCKKNLQVQKEGIRKIKEISFKGFKKNEQCLKEMKNLIHDYFDKLSIRIT